MTEEKLNWYTGSGGPLVLLPEDLVEHWSGIDAPSDGRKIEARGRWNEDGPATDFDRACDVDELIASVELGTGHGIVLGGGPYPTTFIERDGQLMLVRWVQADLEQQVLDAVSASEVDADEGIPAFIDARPGPLVLFDAACPGGEVEDDRLTLELHPGRYVAGAVEIKSDDEIELIVVRLTKVD